MYISTINNAINLAKVAGNPIIIEIYIVMWVIPKRINPAKFLSVIICTSNIWYKNGKRLNSIARNILEINTIFKATRAFPIWGLFLFMQIMVKVTSGINSIVYIND